jgi:hypothetical protein
VAYEETPIYQPEPVAYEETVEAAPAEVAQPIEADSPVEVEAASTWQEEAVVNEPAVVEEPIAVETPAPPAAVEAIAEATIPEVVEAPAPPAEAPRAVAARTPAAPEVDEDKATPSFKAALAAIRAAWGKAPRKGESQGVAPATANAPAALEVDLTGAVEVDEEPVEIDMQSGAMPPHTPVDPAVEAVEVYELSVEADLSELETQLITPPAPQREEQPAPKVSPTAPMADERKAVESAPAAGAEANGSRKKGKRAVTKGAKAPAPRQGKAQPQAAQNEWGIFDEVADEKTKQPQNGSKVRVISLS